MTAPDPSTDAALLSALHGVSDDAWAGLRAAAGAFAAEPEHVTWSTVPGEVPYPVYGPATTNLMAALTGLIGVTPFDWQSWGGLQRYPHGAGLAAAPVTEALRLIVAVQRSERTSEGSIGAAADDGTLMAIVDRLIATDAGRSR